MSRGVSLRDIDPSMLGPHSPLLELMRRKPRRDREHQEQVKVFTWVFEHEKEMPDLRWLFAVPNWIGTHTAKHGARLKAEGRKAGVPDLILPLHRGHFAGLVIEMKFGKNRPTPEQRAWIDHFTGEGWCTRVCYSAAEALAIIEEYINEPVR